jgi:hypothetical protein
VAADAGARDQLILDRHAALQPSEYTLALQGSSSWYYVEYLDNTDLLHYTDNPNINSNGLNLFKTVANNTALNMPRMILYHLFYPLHQETLEGCEDAGEGRLFGTYAGEWACIAILMDPSGKPSHIGLTSRNTGSPSMVSGYIRPSSSRWSFSSSTLPPSCWRRRAS